MKTKIISLILLMYSVNLALAQADITAGPGEWFERQVKGLWLPFIGFAVLGGGAMLVIKYGIGKERDIPKAIAGIVMIVASIMLIAAAYTTAKSINI